MIVGNPGDISESQTDWAIAGQDAAVDVLVVKEDYVEAYIPWVQPGWAYPGTDRSHAYRLAHIVRGVRFFIVPWGSQERKVVALSRKRHAGYVFITDYREGSFLQLPRSWRRRAPMWPTKVSRG